MKNRFKILLVSALAALTIVSASCGLATDIDNDADHHGHVPPGHYNDNREQRQFEWTPRFFLRRGKSRAIGSAGGNRRRRGFGLGGRFKRHHRHQRPRARRRQR